MDDEELAQRTKEAEDYIDALRNIDRKQLEFVLRQCYVAKFSRKRDRGDVGALLRTALRILEEESEEVKKEFDTIT